MSAARGWTLPNGSKLRVGMMGPFYGVQVQMPGGPWVDLARSREDAEALTVALCAEVKPSLGVSR